MRQNRRTPEERRNKVKEILKQKNLSIIDCLRAVSEGTICSQFHPTNMRMVKPATDLLCDKLHVNVRQAVFISIIANNGTNGADMGDMAEHLNLDSLEMLPCENDLEDLCHHYILFVDGRNNHYYLTSRAWLSIREDKELEQRDMKNLKPVEFYRLMHKQFSRIYNYSLSPYILMHEIQYLIDNNPKIGLCKLLADKHIEDEDAIVTTFFATEFCRTQDNKFSIDRMNSVLENEHYDVIATYMSQGKGVLFTNKTINFTNNEGLTQKDFVSFTDEVLDKYFSEVNSELKNGGNNYLIQSEGIIAKHLIYNAEEQVNVEKLERILSGEEFEKLKERLTEMGERTGVVCLFYGDPGTGKTETVLQLAKHSGRSIYKVDLSQVRDCWVGESEKNVKKIFDRYRSLCRTEKLTPILLLNEADGLIGKRFSKVERSVDQMENTMQNIFLEELERFEGILIATTNLEGNLDGAFERRFLFKVRFNKPSAAARSLIWKTKLTSLTDSQTKYLGEAFNLSGGEIENVARKTKITYIIDGEQPDFNTIAKFCKEEGYSKKKGNVVGFKSA